jgi:hypothetical protein
MQVPPGQHHESPTEQYWNALPTEQPAMMPINSQPNVNVYVQNSTLNNNMGMIGDYDGIELALEEGEWSC